MGLYRHDLDTGRFDSCAPPVDQLGILELVQSGDGRIFFATSDGRLWTLDPADADRRARPLNDGAFAALTDITALARGRGIRDLGRRDTAACSRSMSRARAGAGSTEALRGSRHGVRHGDAIGRATSGSAGPTASCCATGPPTARVDRFPQAPRHTLAILPGKGGEIWIGARGGGLSRLDPKTGELVVYRHDPEDPASLSSDDVAAIYEDAIGSLWIGTWNGGVNRFDPHAQAFRTFRHRARVPDSLPADDVIGDDRDARRQPLARVAQRDRQRRRSAERPVPDRGRASRQRTADRARVVGRTASSSARRAGWSSSTRRPAARCRSTAALQAHRLGERPIAAIRSALGRRVDRRGQRAVSRRADAARGPVRVERLDVPIAGSVSALSTSSATGRLWIGSDSGEIVRAEWSGAWRRRSPCEPLDVEARRRATRSRRTASSRRCTRIGRDGCGWARGAASDASS